MKAKHVFFSDSLSEDEIESFLKREINPPTKPKSGKGYQYRADHESMEIKGQTIYCDVNRSRIKYFKKLQERLRIIDIIKKHKDLIVNEK